jgi:arsenite methyltransferase
MSALKFTEEAARRLEEIYLTRDVVAQRSETIRLLSLSQGEHVLDVGCGPGFLCAGMGALVGGSGAVLGIDISHDLIDRCKQRNVHAWISYEVGDATRLERPDASFDVVVCTQVAEYVPDVDKVLSEAFRVLRPGGRSIVVATDWDTVLWHSENPNRMDRIMKSWEAHCAHPHLPRSLPRRLRAAGFRFDGASVFPILNLQWEDNAYSKGMTGLIRDFVAAGNDVALEELRAWAEEFTDLSNAGEYFFYSARFIFRASKPIP